MSTPVSASFSVHKNFGAPQNLPPWINKFTVALTLFAVFQLWFSYRIRRTLYFCDDLEALAAAVYFHDLYRTWMCFHLPVHSILAHWWVSIAGSTPLSNRMMAGTEDAVILVLLAAIGWRLQNYVTGILAAFLFLCLELHMWAFLNLSELPSVMFALCAVYFGLRFSPPKYQIEIARPFWFGCFLALSVLSRFMAIPMAGFVFLLPFLGSDFLRKIRTSVLPTLVGALVPSALIAGYFAMVGSLKALIFWSLMQNFGAKWPPNWAAWIGDLSATDIRQIWTFNFAVLGLGLISYAFAARRNPLCVRGLAICFLPGLGGWIGGNPSGISSIAFHAIPAMPFFSLTLAFALTCLWTSTGSLPRGALLWAGRPALIGTAIAVALPFVQRTIAFAWEAPASAGYEHAMRIGDYIAKHTKPSDRLFVFGADPFLYVTANRKSATEITIVSADIARYQDRILKELQEVKPAAIVIDKTDYWYNFNLAAYPKTVSYIINNYRVSRQYDDVLLKPSPEATDQVILDTNAVGSLDENLHSIMHVGYRWKRVLTLIPESQSSMLTFSAEREWRETYVPILTDFSTLGRTRNLVLEVNLVVEGAPGSFHPYPQRILFLGPGGQKLTEFSWTWVPVKENPKIATYFVPLTSFHDVHGDFSWSKTTGIQIGGWGPAGGKVKVYSVNVLAPSPAQSQTAAVKSQGLSAATN
jgi:hypothetical protein